MEIKELDLQIQDHVESLPERRNGFLSSIVKKGLLIRK
jgi:hypothetical protein